jgi:hypothetical protein
MNLDRGEYGLIYHRTFGKQVSKKDCREGWERWQQVMELDYKFIVVHPPGTPMPDPHANDYWAVATLGPLWFQARINESFLPQLPEVWLDFSRGEPGTQLLATCGEDPRRRARSFVHNSLVCGFVMHPVIGPAMASALAWLLSTLEGQPIRLSDFHLFGYDISHVPGPLGQPRMFNFRALLSQAPEDTLAVARALPLPKWRLPPY